MNTLEYNPTTTTGLAAGLDYYKPTMSQLAYEQEPGARVTFTYHNRGNERLADYVDARELQVQFDDIGARGWSAAELAFLDEQRSSAGQRVFSRDYLIILWPKTALMSKKSSGRVTAASAKS
jgi:nicotinic acid phosphoribosyltransferase